jgi:ATP-binding protein involved in chromosome partitioning
VITENEINSALSKVMYPGFTKDIITFGFVKNIDISSDNVSILIEISSSAPEVAQQLIEDIKNELAVVGVKNPNLTIKQPSAPKEQSNSKSGKNIAPNIKNFIMVSSGKGGVGKSTTTVNLAVGLAMQGKKVGVLDADIYGPNIPRMLGITKVEPEIVNNKVIPIKAYGLEVMSMGLLMDEGQSLIWRGSMIMKAIEQFLRDITWGDLDVLVIDMPPGTGDAQLTLAQSVPVTAGINVTTPQHVALDDSRRSLDMFKKLHIPIAGVIENMSGFICPECDTESDIFGKGTCADITKEFDTVVLGEIPIEPAIREGGDGGKPIVYFAPESKTAKKYLQIAHKTWEMIEKINSEGGASNEAIQPTTPPGVSACSTQGQSGGQAHSHSGGCSH